MNITGFEVFRYKLPLKETVMVRDAKMESREGFVLKLTNEIGHSGFGEISPLPGLSREITATARQQITSLRTKLLNGEIPGGVEKCSGQFEKWLAPYQLSSSVRFGLEMAVMSLVAQSRRQTVSDLIPGFYHEQVHLSGLLLGPHSAVVAQAQEMIGQGFRSLKLKIGRQKLKDDIQTIKAVHEICAGKALLRLDANQSLDYGAAVTIGKEISCAAVEYIEEPFPQTEMIPEFFQETMIPVALDETLLDRKWEDIKSIEGVDVLVVKPTVLGGIEKTLQLVKTANSYGIEVVISSAFETGLGLAVLIAMAGSLKGGPAAGLDTIKWFRKDLLVSPLQIIKGNLANSRAIIKDQDIDFSVLESLEK